MKEGIVQLVLGRKVLLLNKITSFGWNGLVIAFSTAQSQTVSAKQQNRIYTVKMEKKWWQLRSGGILAAHLECGVCTLLCGGTRAPTAAAWSAAALPGGY